MGFESESFEFVYEAKDVILYNLGVGASLGQSNGLDLLYEGSEKFGALTSFGVIPGFPCLSALITGQVPGLQIDLSRVSNHIIMYMKCSKSIYIIRKYKKYRCLHYILLYRLY